MSFTSTTFDTSSFPRMTKLEHTEISECHVFTLQSIFEYSQKSVFIQSRNFNKRSIVTNEFINGCFTSLEMEYNVENKIYTAMQMYVWSLGVPCTHTCCLKQKLEAQCCLSEALQYDSPSFWRLLWRLNWSIAPLQSNVDYHDWNVRSVLWQFIAEHQLIKVAVMMLNWFPQDQARINILLFQQWSTVLYQEFIQHLSSTDNTQSCWFHYDRFEQLTPILQQRQIDIQYLCHQLYSLQYYDALSAHALRAMKCNFIKQQHII